MVTRCAWCRYSLPWRCVQTAKFSSYHPCRYPGGYTLLFIPSYSPDYTGQHWAVYDNNYDFTGFDINDATSGETCF